MKRILFVVMVVCSAVHGMAENHVPTRIVTDARGKMVAVPQKINRVVTISDGLVESVMLILGVQDTLMGVGSYCLQHTFDLSWTTEGGETFSRTGGGIPVTMLYPRIKTLPRIAMATAAPNYEEIARLKPDVMIVRVGSCWHYNDNDQAPTSIKRFESMNIPVIVLHSPNTFDSPDIETLSLEIVQIGQVFGRENRAQQVADFLEDQARLVRERTAPVPMDKRPRVLLFGLSPGSRSEGGAGTVSGVDTIESFFLESIVHAVNAYHYPGFFKTVGTEQILALDPDVIILPTALGYHPPRELYEASYYRNLRNMRAVKARRVAALPFSPCNCDKRLEYPVDIMVMAKAAYPERFRDINMRTWLLHFYRTVYGVSEEGALGLLKAQWMDI